MLQETKEKEDVRINKFSCEQVSRNLSGVPFLETLRRVVAEVFQAGRSFFRPDLTLEEVKMWLMWVENNY